MSIGLKTRMKSKQKRKKDRVGLRTRSQNLCIQCLFCDFTRRVKSPKKLFCTKDWCVSIQVCWSTKGWKSVITNCNRCTHQPNNSRASCCVLVMCYVLHCIIGSALYHYSLQIASIVNYFLYLVSSKLHRPYIDHLEC